MREVTLSAGVLSQTKLPGEQGKTQLQSSLVLHGGEEQHLTPVLAAILTTRRRGGRSSQTGGPGFPKNGNNHKTRTLPLPQRLTMTLQRACLLKFF